MKRTVCSSAIVVLLVIFIGNIKAQSVGKSLSGSKKLLEKKENNIISFAPVFNEGKTYVRWMVENDEEDGIFIIEKSPDGLEFEALGFKDRIGSNLCVNLFYSYVDEAPFKGQTFYRLMQVGADNTFSYSDIVRVKTETMLPAGGANASISDPK